MPDPQKPEPVEEQECGPGRCVPEHPLHCCHTARTIWLGTAIRNVFLVGWRCDCGKKSQVWTLVRARD